MKILKNVNITLFLFFILLGMPVFALNLDETVDDDIRKNYNSNKLIEDVKITDTKFSQNIKTKGSNDESLLPVLPDILKKQNNSNVYNNLNMSNQQNVKQYTYTRNSGIHKISKNAVFSVISNHAVSDTQKEGTKITFKTQRPLKIRNYTLPAGTLFYGEITDSHTPQISCNGGLVVMTVYAMRIKNEVVPISAYITKANGKHIFFNNIKGKRTYLKTVYKKGHWGRTMFCKMWNLTVTLGKDGSTIILTPFPFLYGTVCVGANTIISPVTAFFSRGGYVYIPAGRNFNIKLEDDVYFD